MAIPTKVPAPKPVPAESVNDDEDMPRHFRVTRTINVISWLIFVFGILGGVGFMFATPDGTSNSPYIAAGVVIIIVSILQWALLQAVTLGLDHLLVIRLAVDE